MWVTKWKLKMCCTNYFLSYIITSQICLFHFFFARFQVPTVYKIITFFWNGKTCNMAGIRQHFEYKGLQLTYITLTRRNASSERISKNKTMPLPIFYTSYIYMILWLLVIFRKNLASVAILIIPLNAIWNNNQSRLHDGKTREIQSHHINTPIVTFLTCLQQWSCKLI